MALTISTAGTHLRRAVSRAPVSLQVLAVFLYSTGPVMVASSSVSGPVFSFWRLWCGVGILGLATLVLRLRGAHPIGTQGRRWAWRAGLAFGVHQLLFMSAIKASSVVDTTLIGTLQPVVVALLAVPLFGERPGPTFRAWSAVAILGAAGVIVAGSTGPDANAWGMTLATLNVFAFSLFFVASKLSRAHISVVPFLFGVMLVAAIVVSLFVFAAGDSVTTAEPRDLMLAAAVALIPGTLGHAFMTWPLRWVAANVAPLLKLAVPALAGGFAWVLLGQPVTPMHVVGGIVTIAGVAGALLTSAGRALVNGTK